MVDSPRDRSEILFRNGPECGACLVRTECVARAGGGGEGHVGQASQYARGACPCFEGATLWRVPIASPLSPSEVLWVPLLASLPPFHPQRSCGFLPSLPISREGSRLTRLVCLLQEASGRGCGARQEGGRRSAFPARNVLGAERGNVRSSTGLYSVQEGLGLSADSVPKARTRAVCWGHHLRLGHLASIHKARGVFPFFSAFCVVGAIAVFYLSSHLSFTPPSLWPWPLSTWTAPPRLPVKLPWRSSLAAESCPRRAAGR